MTRANRPVLIDTPEAKRLTLREKFFVGGLASIAVGVGLTLGAIGMHSSSKDIKPTAIETNLIVAGISLTLGGTAVSLTSLNMKPPSR